MAELEKIETHVEDALARLLERHKGRPNIEAFVTSFAEKIQALENAAWDYQTMRSVTTATGYQLDLIGDVVGQLRLGTDDDFYRVLIIVKIAINNSQGSPEQLISIFNLLTGSTRTMYLNLKRGRVRIQGNGENPLSSGALLYAQLERVVLGGVALKIMGFTNDTPFTFAGGDGQGLGFYNPAAAENGKFGTLLRRE